MSRTANGYECKLKTIESRGISSTNTFSGFMSYVQMENEKLKKDMNRLNS
jgi:hypothetical protein